MIKSVHLLNFQSHKDTLIDFDEGVNAICGLTDSGKTAILRAINWVINNKPSGADFQSNWGGETEVTLVTTDGHTVCRRRTKSDNLYILDGAEYRAFGQDVPTEIRAALNMSDVNMQYQMDGPFILSMSSGEVAQYLNKIVRLDVIDSSASYVRKMGLDVNASIRVEDAKLEDTNSQLEKVGDLNLIESELTRLENGLAEKLSTEDKIERLKTTRMKLASMRTDLIEFEKVGDQETSVNRLKGITDELSAVVKAHSALNNLKTTLSDQLNTLSAASPLVAHSSTLDDLLQGKTELEYAKKKFESLDYVSATLDSQLLDLKKLEGDILVYKKRFNELMPDICPLCGE